MDCLTLNLQATSFSLTSGITDQSTRCDVSDNIKIPTTTTTTTTNNNNNNNDNYNNNTSTTTTNNNNNNNNNTSTTTSGSSCIIIIIIIISSSSSSSTCIITTNTNNNNNTITITTTAHTTKTDVLLQWSRHSIVGFSLLGTGFADRKFYLGFVVQESGTEMGCYQSNLFFQCQISCHRCLIFIVCPGGGQWARDRLSASDLRKETEERREKPMQRFSNSSSSFSPLLYLMYIYIYIYMPACICSRDTRYHSSIQGSEFGEWVNINSSKYLYGYYRAQ